VRVAFRTLGFVTDDRSAADRELARLRAKSGEQELELARLRDEAPEASSELAQLGADADELQRRERDLTALIERLRGEARVHEDVVNRLLERLAADERELNDLRAVRDALTPAELASRPGVDLAATFLPATKGVSGDSYLVADGPHDATALVVGDVVGKGLVAARRAAFTRTVFSTTAPFSDDQTQLLSWANTALVERDQDELEFVTVGCVTVSPSERLLRWGYAGHPPVLWLDSGEELSGARAPPLGVSQTGHARRRLTTSRPAPAFCSYTDGVTEARHNGEQFDQTRLAESVQTLGGRAPAEVMAAITTEVQGYVTGELADDLCVVPARTDDS
jgi:serine phosphatase RsbU (regulator of sigma subunit)